MAAKVPYYRGVRGSSALATRPLQASALAPEALEAGEMRRVPFAGELLGAVRVRSAYAAIPLEAFDRACEVLDAEEQAAYLHLLRLSVGEGRNWCRVAKRELIGRIRLSERRLLRVLAALVDKRFARPLHRDNRGTLWRVYLPREAAGEPLGDGVLMGRAAALRLVREAGRPGSETPAGPATAIPAPTQPGTQTPTTGATRPPPLAAAGTRAARAPAPAARPRAVPTEAGLARALAEARGRADPDGVAAALREVKELLSEGQPPQRIAACIETVRKRAARAAQEGQP